MFGNNERYFYWVFVPGILSYLTYYVYSHAQLNQIKRFAHLKDFDQKYLPKGVRKLEHEDMKVYVVGIDDEEDPERVKLIREVIKDSKTDKLVLEMCD